MAFIDSVPDNKCAEQIARDNMILILFQELIFEPFLICRKRPKVPHFNDYRALLGFSTSMRGAVSSLKNGGYENGMNSVDLFQIIIEKLPADI